MINLCHLSVCYFDLLGTSLLRDPQQIIVVYFQLEILLIGKLKHQSLSFWSLLYTANKGNDYRESHSKDDGDRIRPAGRIVNFSNKGNIILRSESPPRLGDLIVDKRSNSIGKVIRITGPVSSPYVILSSKVEDQSMLRGLLGKEVFISDRQFKGRTSSRKRHEASRKQPGRGRIERRNQGSESRSDKKNRTDRPRYGKGRSKDRK
jgi:rRNA processing protein Gar1